MANVPYGLNIIESCLTCKFREDRLFCQLGPDALKKLSAIKSMAMYPKGALLFIEGQLPRGVFILCQGKAKLSTSSRNGKTIILKMAEAGEVLGLSATVSGRPYEVSVEMMEPAQANFIARDQFLAFLQDHGEVALRVAQQLSENYHSAYEEIRTLGLTASASEKLAKLILQWSGDAGNRKTPLKLQVTTTHEEIAEMIGTSRETVSRVFSDFKKKQLLEVKGASLTIRDKAGLERLIRS
ncbi:MAG: Crp/Fnr family transcriptional regulator [Terriglobales bacterium]